MGAAASLAPASTNPFKAEGDACHKAGQYLEAIFWYTKAMQPVVVDGGEEGGREPTGHEMAILLSNRAASLLSSSQPQAALQDALRGKSRLALCSVFSCGAMSVTMLLYVARTCH